MQSSQTLMASVTFTKKVLAPKSINGIERTAIKSNPHPDQKYIDALLHNNTPVLNELYQKFSGTIKRMILQNNGTEADAADILQDALLSLYDKAKTEHFVLTCPLNSFLYLVCKNRWINELKKRKSQNVIFTDVCEDAYAAEDSFKIAEESLQQQERKNLLEERFQQLTESNKQLLRLCFSGKSMEETARALNVSYGYARKKKSECMAKLISLVKQSPEFNLLKALN